MKRYIFQTFFPIGLLLLTIILIALPFTDNHGQYIYIAANIIEVVFLWCKKPLPEDDDETGFNILDVVSFLCTLALGPAFLITTGLSGIFGETRQQIKWYHIGFFTAGIVILARIFFIGR